MRTLVLSMTLLAACQPTPPDDRGDGPVIPVRPLVIRAGKPVANLAGERWFRNVRQLTFGGENAEAYFSGDGRKLILQSKRPPHECDQIYTLDLATGQMKLISSGKGRTTCSYFLQGDREIIYSSTYLAGEGCPPLVRHAAGRYVWPVHAGYDIFRAQADGSRLRRLTETPGYDAEATVCPVTGRILFTSMRDGDLEIYSMEPDGSDVERLTQRPGYDGGAFYSHSGTKIVLRSGFLRNEDEKQAYVSLLAQGLVEPTHMEITVMGRHGEHFHRVTNNGKANFAPYWHPDDRRIVFASNMDDPRGRDFELYLIGEDGKGLVRLTHDPAFDAFPMFSPDGKYLVFASNRFNAKAGETNLFVAEWIERAGG